MTGSFNRLMRNTCVVMYLAMLCHAPAAIGVSSSAKNDGVVTREAKGLHGMLLLTPDKDWQAKWQTPEQTIPEFNTRSTIYLGETLSVLGFVANAKSDTTGAINIHCALQLVTPSGKTVVSQPEATCMTGKIRGKTANLYMLPAGAAVMAEPSDEQGFWTVHYQITDKNRQVTLELKTSFELIHQRRPAQQVTIPANSNAPNNEHSN